MPRYDVQNMLETMSPAQKLKMLRDVIQNMVERADNEEMAKFLDAQLGGDAEQVCYSYAQSE
jgi:hypothetical protein